MVSLPNRPSRPAATPVVVPKGVASGVVGGSGPPPAPALTISGVPAAATVGANSSFVPAISGGTPPYVLSLAGGALPGGRAIAGLAETGSYTTAGAFNYALRVTDSKGVTADLPVAIVVGNAAVMFRQATTGTADADGLNALGSGITKRRLRNPMPLMIGAGQTGRCRLTMGGYYVDKSINGERQEKIISWSGVTAMGAQVHCVNAAGTVVGNLLRLKKGAVESFVPAAGDVVFDLFAPADLGLTEWPDGGQIIGMMEIDAASGTLLPMTYVSGSSGDAGAGSYDGGTTSFGSTTFSANGGSNAGTRLCQFLKCEIEHTKGAIFGQGTSRVDGKGNNPTGYGLSRGGFMQQAAYRAGKPMAKFATDGDRIEYMAANIRAGQRWRLNHVAGFTDAYIDELYNDINTRPLADILTDLDFYIAQLLSVNPTLRIHLGMSTVRSTSASGKFLAPPDQTPNPNYLLAGSGTGFAYNQAIVGRPGVTSTYNCRPDIYYSADYPNDWYSDNVTNNLMTPEGDHFTAFGETRVGRADGSICTHMKANVA